MTFEQFVKKFANRTNHQIRIEASEGPFCEKCFDDDSKLISTAFNGQTATWNCKEGHRIPTDRLPLSGTVSTGLR